jgi:hypothetical protein
MGGGLRWRLRLREFGGSVSLRFRDTRSLHPREITFLTVISRKIRRSRNCRKAGKYMNQSGSSIGWGYNLWIVVRECRGAIHLILKELAMENLKYVRLTHPFWWSLRGCRPGTSKSARSSDRSNGCLHCVLLTSTADQSTLFCTVPVRTRSVSY